MAQRPDLRGRLTFVQIGVPSRSDLRSYAAIETEIGERIAAINARYDARDAGAAELRVGVLAKNTAARRLYLSRDFTPHPEVPAKRLR